MRTLNESAVTAQTEAHQPASQTPEPPNNEFRHIAASSVVVWQLNARFHEAEYDRGLHVDVHLRVVKAPFRIQFDHIIQFMRRDD